MDILNLLTYTFVDVFDGQLANVPLSGVNSLVAKIIEYFSFGGSIAVGILLFSLILKIIPLPLDIYSRASSKKSALKMEKMRPELEKLQRQYANNSQLYQQKVMALYKKEGYSQFAACLPTLFTLIFFIVVINAFTQYSTYTKVDTFNQMATAYTVSVSENEYVEKRKYNEVEYKETIEGVEVTKTRIEFSEDGSKEGYFFDDSQGDYNVLVVKPAQDAAALKYFKISENAKFLWVENIWIQDLPWKEAFISKEDYLNSTFTYTKGCSSEQIKTGIKSEAVYDILMGSSLLNEEKNKPNGYLILVVLSIATMFISQLLMTKAQKAQMELQTVDGMNGQAAQTTKMMTWMMPIMFGVFSFMYTASFSLYLIVSTVFSTFSTMIINKIVEKSFEKKLKKEEEDKYNKRYGHLINKK
ncbi:MAG: membrane protein insertase YidC [Clostridia bacterium]|nr:membrane protein insertase YidC [Clostridia bacterium]